MGQPPIRASGEGCRVRPPLRRTSIGGRGGYRRMLSCGEASKNHIFGRINRKNIQYLSGSIKTFILFTLLCVKNVARSLSHHYTYYLSNPSYLCVSIKLTQHIRFNLWLRSTLVVIYNNLIQMKLLIFEQQAGYYFLFGLFVSIFTCEMKFMSVCRD